MVLHKRFYLINVKGNFGSLDCYEKVLFFTQFDAEVAEKILNVIYCPRPVLHTKVELNILHVYIHTTQHQSLKGHSTTSWT